MAATGHRNDTHPGMAPAHRREELQSIAFRHEHIGDHQIENPLGKAFFTFPAVAGDRHLVAALFQHQRDHFAKRRLIIDE